MQKEMKKTNLLLVGIILVILTSAIDILTHHLLRGTSMWLITLLISNPTLYYALSGFAIAPIGAILSSILGNRTTGLMTFAITGIFYILTGRFPDVVCAFAVVIICSLLYENKKIIKPVKVALLIPIFSGIVVATGVWAGVILKDKYNMRMSGISTIVVIIIGILVAIALEKLPVLKRFDEENQLLDKNYRLHSINRKLMLVTNVICIILMLAFSILSIMLLTQKEKERKAGEERIWQTLLYNAIQDEADVFAEHDLEAIKAENIRFRDALSVGQIESPAYIIITTNYDGTYVEQYYEITKADAFADYAYDVEWIREVELTKEQVEKRILLPGQSGNSSIAISERSRAKEEVIDAIQKILAVALILMVLMNIFVDMFVRRNIVRPINLMTTEAMNFAFGEKSEEESNSNSEYTRIEINSGDEIETLSRAFHKTMDDVEAYIVDVNEKSKQVSDMQHNIIITMADIIESRDLNTGGHIRRTALYVGIVAKKLMKDGYCPEVLTQKYLDDMIVAAPLHDMGKIHVSDEILNKNGKLTDEEFAIMKSHAAVGKELLDVASESLGEFSYLMIAKQMAESHHEWWNGKGYPNNLEGDNIPLCARIMAVADVFDALVSKRCYKEPMDLDVAFGIIEKETGTHFDPVVGKTFLDCRPEVEDTLMELRAQEQ